MREQETTLIEARACWGEVGSEKLRPEIVNMGDGGEKRKGRW